MFDRPALVYRYDGTLDGLLCCVFESYVRKEEPMDILEKEASLFPCREIEADPQKAARVARSLLKISQRVFDLVQEGMLCAMPGRGMVVYRFIRLAYQVGDKAALLLTDDTVATLHSWTSQLHHEAHLYTGFVRFTDWQGALVAKIEPKGQILPLIAGHFAGRYPGERFLIFDAVHRMALVHQPGHTAILPVEDLEFPPTTPEEAQSRRLWRAYHQAISIRERENPRAQRGHLALRYRNQMTEFQPDVPPEAPLKPKALP